MQKPGTASDHDLPTDAAAHADDTPGSRADAERDARLEADPSDVDAKLDEGLAETFPTSDPPSTTQPGSNEPAPSTGFDEDEERRQAEKD